MKKILIFTTAYFPHVGGAEVAIAEITKRLSDTHEFDLICARYTKLPSIERVGNVNVYRVGIGVRLFDKLIAPFVGAALALSLQRKQAYEAYWAVMATYGSGAAYITRWFTKVPVVLTLQEGDSPTYLKRKWFGLVALSWRLALSKSAAVTVISTYLGTLAKEFGYRGEPVLVPNGVDVERFSGILRTPHEGTVLVTTSRLVHKNAVDDVIRALTYLPDTISFTIYGKGPDEKKLRRLTHIYGLERRVHFMGHVAYEELPEALSKADVFVRPSRSEGMGNSFLEAMAAGLPVIATQEGGIADFLYDRERNPNQEPTGWAVDTDAPKQIAEKVRHILANSDEVSKTTENARRVVKEQYDWNLIAEKMRQVFDQTLEKR